MLNVSVISFFFPIVTNTTNNVLHYLELLKSLLINIIGKNPEYDNLMAFCMYDHVMVVVVKLCLTLASPWTVACQAPLSIGFSRQEYWSGLLFPSPGDLFHPRIESRSSVLQAYAAILSYEGIPWSCWKVKVVQLCPTLCDPFGILQARILEWVAFPFSRGPSQPTQGSNSGVPHCRRIFNKLSHKGNPIILEWVSYPSPVDLPYPGSPALQVDSLPTELVILSQILPFTVQPTRSNTILLQKTLKNS